MNKILFILRSVSGAGKSTTAELISYVNYEADMFFMNSNGEYNFNPKQLPQAHQWCWKSVKDAMDNGIQKICVSNTNTREQDVEKYRTLAINKGYMPIVLTVENWHGGTNVHDVPKSSLERMEQQLKQSIRLR